MCTRHRQLQWFRFWTLLSMLLSCCRESGTFWSTSTYAFFLWKPPTRWGRGGGGGCVQPEWKYCSYISQGNETVALLLLKLRKHKINKWKIFISDVLKFLTIWHICCWPCTLSPLDWLQLPATLCRIRKENGRTDGLDGLITNYKFIHTPTGK